MRMSTRVTGGMPATDLDYLRDPAAIERRSAEIARAATRLEHLPADLHPFALALVRAIAEPTIVDDLVASPGFVARARAALEGGGAIMCDAAMVAAGIARARLTAGNEIVCSIAHAEARAIARRQATTRSAAAVTLWRPRLAQAIVAIGNAPTALFRLLEELAAGAPAPAAIIAFPVGFVGAAESKQTLIDARMPIPFVTLRGPRGGSALAVAAINALASPA
jgi:precorrin isomerase